MKLSYYDLLGDYKELSDKQSDSEKEALATCKEVMDNNQIQEIISFLSQQETEYSTYSHN